MSTPTFALIFKMASEWVAKHRALLVIIWTIVFTSAGIVANKFVMADEFRKHELEAKLYQEKTTISMIEGIRERNINSATIELDRIRREIDDFKRIPDYQTQTWAVDHIKRRERREAVLEKKISS